MKEILFNTALLDTLEFCKRNNIDCSGTHLYKYPRRFTYALVKDKDSRAVVTTTLYKSQVPTHVIHKYYSH